MRKPPLRPQRRAPWRSRMTVVREGKCYDAVEEWVGLREVLGTDRVPREVADLLYEVVKRMVESGDVSVKGRWQAVEFLAAEWLASQQTESA